MDHINMLAGSYNYPLVALSVLIAIGASYAALDLATGQGRNIRCGNPRGTGERSGTRDVHAELRPVLYKFAVDDSLRRDPNEEHCR